jgi:hypothetical protein
MQINISQYLTEGKRKSPEEKQALKWEKYKKSLMKHFNLDLDKFKPKIKGGIKDKGYKKEKILTIPLSRLIAGIKVEKEHTTDVYLQLEIALGHFLEGDINKTQDYYVKLKKYVESD